MSDGKVAEGFPSPTWCRFSPTGKWCYIECFYQGGILLNSLPLPSVLQINLQGDGLHVHDEYDLSS